MHVSVRVETEDASFGQDLGGICVFSLIGSDRANRLHMEKDVSLTAGCNTRICFLWLRVMIRSTVAPLPVTSCTVEVGNKLPLRPSDRARCVIQDEIERGWILCHQEEKMGRNVM